MSPSNTVERYKLNDSFDNVECCFDTVAVFGNNVSMLSVSATVSNEISSCRQCHCSICFNFVSKGRNFTIESFDIVAVCGNRVERCFDNVACCFDILAGVDGALGYQGIAAPLSSQLN